MVYDNRMPAPTYLQGPCEGILAMKRPWPSMMRTVAGDHDRFEQTYFSMFKGLYFTGTAVVMVDRNTAAW